MGEGGRGKNKCLSADGSPLVAAGAGVSALIQHQYVSDRQMIEKEPGRRGDEKRRCLCCVCVCVCWRGGCL